jgi:Salt stress response/antifungal
MHFKSKALPFSVFLLVLSTAALVDAKQLIDSCSADDSYTNGSIFQSNLQELLSSLRNSAINSSGFSNITVGDPMSPNRVSGVLMCYGDKTPDECEACINSTTANMTQLCPYSKRATVIDDRCYLRYSNENFLGVLTSDQDYYDKWIANASSQSSFNKTLYNLIDTLSKDASNAQFLYATGYSMVSGSNETVYVLVQCRRDLSAEDCHQAIADALQYTQIFGSIRQSVFVYLTSCYLRYSVYPFVVTIPAIMRVQPSPPSFPSPPSLPPSSGQFIFHFLFCFVNLFLSFL